MLGDCSRCAKDAGADRIANDHSEAETESEYTQKMTASFWGIGCVWGHVLKYGVC